MIYYFFAIMLMSTLTFSLYAADKKKSEKGKWRIRETTLLLSSIFFGALGGLLAMYQLRHKTKHWYFLFINWVALIFQIFVFFYLLTM
jgi:uncharacterized membrane protein YsdA (DUF1294 family)